MPRDSRLRRPERITHEYEYKQVIRKGRLALAKGFKAYFLVSDDLERKAGFIAGKRVGDAWRRNRAKRLLKEAYRLLKPELKPAGFKVVFIASKRAGEASISEIRDQMRELFGRFRLYSNDA